MVRLWVLIYNRIKSRKGLLLTLWCLSLLKELLSQALLMRWNFADWKLDKLAGWITLSCCVQQAKVVLQRSCFEENSCWTVGRFPRRRGWYKSVCSRVLGRKTPKKDNRQYYTIVYWAGVYSRRRQNPIFLLLLNMKSATSKKICVKRGRIFCCKLLRHQYYDWWHW